MIAKFQCNIFRTIFKRLFTRKNIHKKRNNKPKVSEVHSIVPFNTSVDDLHKEYDKLKDLWDIINKEAYIHDINSRLQRHLCINEIRDCIQKLDSYEMFDEARLRKMGKRKREWCTSSDDYIDTKNMLVYKVKDIFYYDKDKEHDPRYSIYEHLLHNILFPNVPYTFLGIGTIEGKPGLVFSQPYITDLQTSEMEDVQAYMKLLGLEYDGYHPLTYTNDYISITAYSCDVLIDENNTLYFLNPIISFRKEPIEVFRHYLNCNNQKNVKNLSHEEDHIS